MPIRPAQIVELDHRAYFLRSAPRQSLLVAVARQGRMSVFGPGFAEPRKIGLPCKEVGDACLHPLRPLVAAVDDKAGSLLIAHLDGSVVFEQKPARGRRFGGAFFEDDGAHLWCAESLGGEDVEVQLRRAPDWLVVASLKIKDPYGGSSCSFFETRQAHTVALWLAAGQDGQQIYWVTRHAGGIRCDLEPQLKDTPPPVFAPGGREFLVADGDGRRLRKLGFPGRVMGECRWVDGDEGGFDYFQCYLDGARALVSVREGRTFLLDTNRMTLLHEVAIENHEPRPVEELYPALAGDRQLCTDLSYFERVADDVIFVSRRDQGTGLDEWKDRLLFVPVKALTSA